MAARRKTPTLNNSGSPIAGLGYLDSVDAEIEALWQCVPERLVNVAGTAAHIVATSDTSVVSQVTTLAAPKSFWLTPIFNNPGATDIVIDGQPVIAIVDVDGNPLLPNALVAGRQHELVSDGAALRLQGGSGGGSSITSDNLVNNGRLSPHTGIYVPGQAYTGEVNLYWTVGERGNQISLYDGISAWSTIASPEVSIKATNAQTGTTHSGTRIIDGLSDTSQLVTGMVISGTGVGGGAVISSVDSPTQVTASVNGTASATNSITFKLPKNSGFDVYGKKVSNALKLFFKPRGALFTATANITQDGIQVNAADSSLRFLGAFRTSNTDGQIDWTLTGQYRGSIWNEDNRVYREHVEAFNAVGANNWYRSFATARIAIDVQAPGGGSGGMNLGSVPVAGGTGGTTSFGGHASATGGAGSTGVGTPALQAPAAGGVGSGGDLNMTGGGFPGAPAAMDSTNSAGPGGMGGRSIQNILAAVLNAIETVTIGARGTAGAGSQTAGFAAPCDGLVTVREVLEL